MSKEKKPKKRLPTASRIKKRRVVINPAYLVLLGATLLFAGHVWAVDYSNGAHGAKSAMSKGCGSCHVGHGKERTPMLPSAEEDLCYECHADSIRSKKSRAKNRLGAKDDMGNIMAEFLKPSHHPVEITGAHNARELSNAPVASMTRHAECIDCHHHHRTERKGTPVAKGLGLKKKSPMDSNDYEYTLCYRCHGRGSNTSPLSEATDAENEFDLTNVSYHPIEGRGTNPDVPSLIQPFTEESLISCSDCHNNDNPDGPNGPHGSIYEPILVKNFNQEDDSFESEFQYDLCYDCHARTSILGNQSFPLHQDHTVEQRTSCHTCHNSHGSRFNTNLIFFNPEVVSPNSDGRLEFIDKGTKSGECFLSCHGKNHDTGYGY